MMENVLFNDPVSAYISKVADELLINDPNLRKKLNIFVLNVSQPNAYATHNGIIYFTTGLLARLNTEAELAFILAHEITHFQKKHSINAHMENEKIESGTSGYKGLNYNEKLLAQSSYSKENELEADREGLKLLKKSKYNTRAGIDALDVLLHSFLPFKDKPFEFNFLTKDKIDVNEKEAKAAVDTTYIINDDYSDSLSSHPNTKKRKEQIIEVLNGNYRGNDFIQKEYEFTFMKYLCQFELINIYLKNGRYVDALYSNFLLSERHSENSFIKETYLRSIYGIAKYKNWSRYSDKSFKHKYGHLKALYHYINKEKSDNFSLLALSHINDALNENPNSITYQQVQKDLITDCIKDHYITKSDIVMNDTEEHDKIYSEFNTDTSFLNHYAEQCLLDSLSKRRLTKSEIRLKKKKKRKEKRINNSRGYALGIDKVVLLTPDYYKIRNRRQFKMYFIESDKKQDHYVDLIQKNAKKAGLELSVLNNKDFTKNSLEKYNDHLLLNNWSRERFIRGKKSMVSSFNEGILDISNKYNTKYFMWSGVFTESNFRELSVWLELLQSVYFLTIPISVYELVASGKYTVVYNVLFNVETGELVFSDIYEMNRKDRDDILNSRIYSSLSQIKSSRE